MNVADLKAQTARLRKIAETVTADGQVADDFVPTDEEWLAALVILITDEEPQAPAVEHVAENAAIFLQMRAMGFEPWEIAQHSVMKYREAIAA